MQRIDIIKSSGLAYQATMRERAYLLKLVAIPLLVKLIFYFFAIQYTADDNILSRATILLPAYILEGWMLSHWARTLLTDHRWPFVPTGNQSQDLVTIKRRASGVMGGTVSFALINILMAGFYAAIFMIMPMDLSREMTPENTDPTLGLIGLLILALMFFLFRFVWLYIPLALNMPFQRYVRETSNFKFTFGIFGVWLVCFVPAIFLMQFIYGALYSIEGTTELAQPYEMLYLVTRVVLDTVKNIIVTAGIAFAIKDYLAWKTT